ncbi:hypothetical protein HNY73_001264 [Argiope bruennichi]|uniref:Uncharacterized protein n=1 Tax=Argiope bruennichi TaxID=94029 RepID=A0A8T0G215_ARGBR|nr:hypothetical protein HNY73_001264 [Argiope bruennichi]
MLFHKCCQFLMRMMSPPAVGLILIFLIGGLSEIIPTQPPYHFTRRSKLISAITPTSLPHSSPRTHFNNEQPRSLKLKPSLDIILAARTTYKEHGINNKTDDPAPRKNVLLFGNRSPKLSRRLGKESVKDVKEPWMIPPKERQLSKILINRKGIRKFTTTVRSNLNPRTVSSLEYLLNSLLRNKSYRITLSVDGSKKDNYFVKLFENLPNSNSSNSTIDNSTKSKPVSVLKLENGTKLQKPSTNFSRKSFITNMHVLDLTRKPKLKTQNNTNLSIVTIKERSTTPSSKIEPKYVIATSSPITVDLDFTSSTRPSILESQTRKSRRSGRNFPIAGDSKLEEKKDRNHTGGIETLFPNRTVLTSLTDKAKAFNDLFNYTYQISALERGSLFPHDPFQDTDKEFGKRSSFISPYIIPDLDKLASSEVESNTKNTSVYNSLRPRLRTTKSSLYRTTYGQRTYSAPASSKQNQRNGTTPRSRIKVKMLLSETRPEPTSIEIDKNATIALLNNTNNTKDSSAFLPKRSDSIFPRIFERKHRNNTRITPTRSPLGRKTSNSTEARRSRQFRPFANRSTVMPKLQSNISESTSFEINEVITSPTIISETLLRKISENLEKINVTTTTENPSTDAEIATETLELDSVRQPKMTDKENQENIAEKKSRIDPKSFYDYLMKSTMGHSFYNFTLPEYRPGSFFRYDGTYPRKPVLDMAYTRPPPFFKVRVTTRPPIVETTIVPTTFESKRTSIRVSSTFYPNRIQDVTMRFGNVNDPPTTLPSPVSKEGETDESEFRDTVEPGFTMEKLAYLLIGTCCGLSILCLCVVVIAIKCRRALVEKRLKAQFQRRLYQHERMKDSPWQQQMFDHFLYLHGQPDNQSRSSANSCSCQCVTWSLGARNLEASRPLCPSNSRNSLYLCGQKKLPFGAASTLRFESMLNRKSPSPGQGCRNESQNSDSSNENDSLEQCSGVEDQHWIQALHLHQLHHVAHAWRCEERDVWTVPNCRTLCSWRLYLSFAGGHGIDAECLEDVIFIRICFIGVSLQ